MDEYGTRLNDYSIKNHKLYRFNRESMIELTLGVIQSSRVIYHGVNRVEIFELENGEKYYYM